MAKKPSAAAAGDVEARVLVACAFGKVNDVVTLSAEAAAAGTTDGVLDASPEAVAYAKSLISAAD